MGRFLLRLLINALGLYVAVRFVPGIEFNGGPVALVGVAFVFGLLNAIVRPILKLLTCPFIILTLGLFIFVLNAVMLALTSAVSEALGLGFRAPLFWPAFLGALVISAISMVLSVFVNEERARREE